MAYFIGEGYSDAFSVHMADLLAELRDDTSVLLTVGTDAVCGPCPNNQNGLCDKPELVAEYDWAVLRACGLTEGDVLPFGKFTALVQEKVLGAGLRDGICGDCQWNEICAVQKSRWSSGRELDEQSPKG